MTNPNNVVNNILGTPEVLYERKEKGYCERCGKYGKVHDQGFHGGVDLCSKCAKKWARGEE